MEPAVLSEQAFSSASGYLLLVIPGKTKSSPSMLLWLLHCNPAKNQSTRGPTASSGGLGPAWDLSGEDPRQIFPPEWIQQHLNLMSKQRLSKNIHRKSKFWLLNIPYLFT